MHKISPKRTGAALGLLVALIHAVWALLILLGCGQWLINTITHLHMIESNAKVLPFNPLTALELIVVTGIIGFIIGGVLASIWNAVQKN